MRPTAKTEYCIGRILMTGTKYLTMSLALKMAKGDWDRRRCLGLQRIVRCNNGLIISMTYYISSDVGKTVIILTPTILDLIIVLAVIQYEPIMMGSMRCGTIIFV